MLRITDAAAWSCAMNYGCWYAIVRSEKTHTLARNEFQVLMCHHAVRKDTHAGLQRILRHAMNYGCGSAIGCNEWQLLIRHRAVRKDTHTHAGLQRILRHAMNYGCWYAIVRSEKTHTLACNECQVLVGHRAIRKDTHADMQRIPAGDVNTHADMQRIPAGDVTSYRQRRANGF